MGTFETRAHRLTNAVTPTSVGATLTELGNHLAVPRATRVFLTSIEGSMIDAEGPSDVTKTLVLGLFKGGTTLPLVWNGLVLLLARHMARVASGTAANAMVQIPPQVINTNLVGKAYSKELSTGAASNGVTGWGIVALSSVASYEILFDITIHYISEWIGGSGSKKDLDTSFDEEENNSV